MYITLTHSNFNTPIYMRHDEVSIAYVSSADKCTHILVKSLSKDGSMVWPVKETPEEVFKQIKAAMAEGEK